MKDSIINTMKPLSKVMGELQDQGFTNNFEITEEGKLASKESTQTYQPKEVSIINTYRFEGMSDPGDASILYSIKTVDNQLGILLDSYGAENSSKLNEFVQEIPEAK